MIRWDLGVPMGLRTKVIAIVSLGVVFRPIAYPACWTIALRIRSTSSGSRNWFSPSRVACTTLKGLPRPSVFATILWIPANSITALTAPPATIPVPADAGLSSTCSARNWPWTSWGMVPFLIATRTRFFLACWTALEMASGTSAALPLPTPTRPCSSPTTTSAVKLNRLPPLTTLATRLMYTTLSFRFSSSGLIFTIRRRSCLELQTLFAGGLSQGLDPPVVLVAAAVKDDGCHVGLQGPLGDQPAHGDGSRHVPSVFHRALELLVQSRRAEQGPPGCIVDHLGIEVHVAPEHVEPGALGRAEHPEPDPVVPADPAAFPFAHIQHRRLPLLARLAFLANQDFPGVLHSLRLVDVRFFESPDIGGDLTDQVSVSPPDRHHRLFVHLGLNALREREGDGMGKPEAETERPSAQRGLVPDPVDLQDPFKPLRHSLNHVADLVPHKAVERAVLTGIGRALHHGFAIRHRDRDVRRDRPRQGPQRAFHEHLLGVDLDVHALRNGHWLSSDP